MPLVLRQIFTRADFAREAFPEWVTTGELPADLVANEFSTEGNTLSFWQIEDDHSNLDLVLAGLAANRQNLAPFDYAVVDRSELEKAGFSFQKTLGASKDKQANDAWHFDIVNLTASGVVKLATLIADLPDRPVRAPLPKIAKAIAGSVAAKRIATEELSPSIQKRLAPAS